MKSVQLYLACALVLVCAVLTQVKASECPEEMITAAKAMNAACVPEDIKQKKPDEVTEQEKNAMEECYMREARNHRCFDTLTAECGSITDPAAQLSCVTAELAKVHCTLQDFERK